jgi:hypothetical protein
LKPATEATGADIVAPKFFGQLFVAVNDAQTALDVCFRREAAATLAGLLVESDLR